jgi:protein-disulfide isomerase-like protein with CxxC motif
VSSPDLCAWCFGAGSLLEAMDCEQEHVYLPIVCGNCSGTGRRAA